MKEREPMRQLVMVIMRSFRPEARKPATDIVHVPLRVAEAMIAGDDEFVKFGRAHCLRDFRPADIAGMVDAPREEVGKDPVSALGNAELFVSAPVGIPRSGSTVYWPPREFKARVEQEVRAVVGCFVRSVARDILQLPKLPSIFGIVRASRKEQEIELASSGDVRIVAHRTPVKEGKGWSISLFREGKRVAHISLSPLFDRHLPWGKPGGKTFVNQPAAPFDLSVAGFLSKVKGEDAWSAISVAFEVNVRCDEVLVHQPTVVLRGYDAVSRQRLGDMMFDQNIHWEPRLEDLRPMEFPPNVRIYVGEDVPIEGRWFERKGKYQEYFFLPIEDAPIREFPSENITIRHLSRNNGGREEHPACQWFMGRRGLFMSPVRYLLKASHAD